MDVRHGAASSAHPASSGARGIDLGENFVSAVATLKSAKLHYVRGGDGPALLLLHGFPQDWYEYRAIMPRLAKRFTVVAVDLRGIGGSSVISGGFDAATIADDINELITQLKLDRVYVVGHDLGGMATYALLRKHSRSLRGAMILDVPIPGIAGWDEAQSGPGSWHVGFMQTPELPEKLIADRQADFLGYFFNFSHFPREAIAHYLDAYSTPAQLHAAFEIYRAFPANEKFNKAQRGAIDVPLFVGAGEKSPFVELLPKMADGLRAAGIQRVETGLIGGAVHYVVEDQPDAVAELIERQASREATSH